MLNDSIKEKLARSLTADSTDLLPYLPYLLLDFWELGSSPEDLDKPGGAQLNFEQ